MSCKQPVVEVQQHSKAEIAGQPQLSPHLVLREMDLPRAAHRHPLGLHFLFRGIEAVAAKSFVPAVEAEGHAAPLLGLQQPRQFLDVLLPALAAVAQEIEAHHGDLVQPFGPGGTSGSIRRKKASTERPNGSSFFAAASQKPKCRDSPRPANSGTFDAA